MANKKIGKQTVRFERMPIILSSAAVGGKQEGEGPLAKGFDCIYNDSYLGESTWEKAESRMQQEALERALEKSGLTKEMVDYVFAGDLMNQCTASSFALRSASIPFFGLYGACSTMAEALLLSGMAVDGGYADVSAALTSSHFCSSERQYRTPLEYGAQRTPTAQRTATASGAVILADPEYSNRSLTNRGNLLCLELGVTGRIVDFGVTDAANMGAAMAPAAYDTLSRLFRDTNSSPSDYDLIVTGDLGKVGHELLKELFKRDGVVFGDNLTDCGILLYDMEKQDVHSGASGCGCSAAVISVLLLDKLRSGEIKRMIFAGTGALLSPTSTMQGESIPGICHAVCITRGGHPNA